MNRFKQSLLIASLVLLLFTSVGTAKTVVNYWLWLDDPTDQTVQELVQEYNAQNPDVEVVIETIPLANYYDQLLMAISGGGGPDAARFKDWWLGAFYDADLLEDLNPFIHNWDGKDDVVPNLWNTGVIPGEEGIYMMPHQYITFYLYYRADWFAEAGLEPPPITFDDFLEAAQTLTDPANNRYGFGLRGGGAGARTSGWRLW